MLIGMFGGRNPDAVLRGACASSVDSFWLAPRFRNTVFQDSAMATPWAADGNPVGAVLDKGGRGYAFTQATSTSRPLGVLDGDLLGVRGDGTDDFMQAGDVCDLRTYSGVVFIALTPPASGETTGFLIAKGTTSAATTGWRCNRTSTSRYQAHYSDGSALTALTTANFADLGKQLFTIVFDRVAGSIYCRRNGVDAGSAAFTPDAAIDRNVATQLKLLANTVSNNVWNGTIREGLVCIRDAAQITTGFLQDVEGRLAVAHGIETGGGKWSWRRSCPHRRHRRRASRSRRALRWAC